MSLLLVSDDHGGSVVCAFENRAGLALWGASEIMMEHACAYEGKFDGPTWSAHHGVQIPWVIGIFVAIGIIHGKSRQKKM